MTKRLTYKKAVKLVEKHIAEKGADFIYQAPYDGICLYFYQEHPSCIVGHVLNDLKVPAHVFPNFEGQNASDISGYLDEYVTVTAKAEEFLESMQGYQDNGKPWGEALVCAKRDMGDDGDV